MTKLGEYLNKNSVNKSEIARKTGINRPRISELSTKPSAKLRAEELYRIALAIDTSPCDLLEYIYGDIELGKE